MRIALVSDFFYPNKGGVETHIYQLAQCLIKEGHRVIVITHYYGNRRGIRIMKNYLKVFYLPLEPFYNQCLLPTVVATLPYFRFIFRTEKIQLVHGHSAFSTMAHEALFTAAIMDLPTVFTDHSLFGFADTSAIVTNTFLKYSLANTNQAICVSHVGKINTVLRSGMRPENVYVIPNAVDAAFFSPDYERVKDTQKIVVGISSRLVYRKGIDLVVKVIPVICSRLYRNQRVIFMIGGDGPKRIILEEMIENYNLQERVIMLGELTPEQVKQDLLVKCDIFLNTSLTEAFCMAIVEACACGLPVVSTDVGGIPEVLPNEFFCLVKPDVDDIISGLETVIFNLLDDKIPDKLTCNKFVAGAYDWLDITRRTQIVYKKSFSEKWTLEVKLVRLWDRGSVAGPLMACLFLFCHYWIIILDYLYPVIST